MYPDNQPLVSVLMTAFNREKFIAPSIESVLNSTYSNFELIIVDDCSTDQTFDIARRYAQRDKRITVYKNDINLGDYKNRNKAAAYASGKYLKYLDSDDLIYPWGLQAMVYCMEKFPEAGFGVMSYGLACDEAYPVLVTPENAYLYYYFRFALIKQGPSGAIIRRDVFEKAKGFSGTPYVGDSEMWLKLSREYSLVRMPLDLIWWRIHEGQQINEGINNDFYILHQHNVYIDALKHPACPLSSQEKRMAVNNLVNVRYRMILFSYLLKFRFRKAFQLLKASNLQWLNLWKAFRRNKYPF